MEFGGCARVSCGSQQALFLNPTNSRYQQSIGLQIPYHPSNASLYTSIALPRRDCTCTASAKENSNIGVVEKVKQAPAEYPRDSELSNLTALCPLDGRYWNKVNELVPYMSEYGLIHFRVLVEIKWLLKLSQIPEVSEVPSFSEEAESFLLGLIDGFGVSDALEDKKIEKVTNHDVKAVEYFLKQRCQSHPEIAKVSEFFHFSCTSEDINNLAHALMLREAMDHVVLPVIDDLIKEIYNMAEANAQIHMLSRTHGQWEITMHI